jgi:hypothetical protein
MTRHDYQQTVGKRLAYQTEYIQHQVLLAFMGAGSDPHRPTGTPFPPQHCGTLQQTW